MTGRPRLLQTVLDTTDPRRLADFYRDLLGWRYRASDETPRPGEDWLVLVDEDGRRGLAFQKVESLPKTTWPEPGVPQQMHLDMGVGSVDELDTQHERALALGARLAYDRSHTPEEPLRVYADPAGHLFCLFVTAG